MLPQPDEILYDRRRKRLMLQVLPGGKVVLKAPLGTPKRQINNFLEQHADWIAEKRILMSKVATSAQPQHFVEGAQIWLAGRQYPLHLVEKGLKGLVFREGQGFLLAPAEQKKRGGEVGGFLSRNHAQEGHRHRRKVCQGVGITGQVDPHHRGKNTLGFLQPAKFAQFLTSAGDGATGST